MKKILLTLFLLFISSCTTLEPSNDNDSNSTSSSSSLSLFVSSSSHSNIDLIDGFTITADSLFQSYYENETSNQQVLASGVVHSVLEDDLEGAKHQRFIMQLHIGQTLLVAHNIDLAPRVVDLRVGDTIYVYGEYEWNSKGGVVHWTHKDPNGNHEDGWIVYNGQKYW